MNDIDKRVTKTSAITISANLGLSIFKLLAGFFGASYALISDGIDSASDVFSTLIALIGIKISRKNADKNHPFGHERFECVASILLSVALFITGITVGYTGISNIVTEAYKSIQTPTYIALIAAIVSIFVKFGIFMYTNYTAKKVDSSAMKADASNHKADILMSVGSTIGIVGAMNGYPIFDSIACTIICLFILKTAVTIFIDAIRKMTDEACDEETQNLIRCYIENCDKVLRVDSLMTRMFGNRIYIVCEISCNRELPLYEAHEVAENVHKGIEKNFPQVKHISVHVNPYEEELDDKKESENDNLTDNISDN